MNDTQSGKLSGVADWLGIAASSACAVHCVLLPTLLVSGMVLPATFLGGEAFHQAMLFMIIPIAIVAFGLGCRKHKDTLVLALAVIGVAGMIAAVVVPHEVLGENGERIITVISAAILVVAHYRNFRLCRASECGHEA